MRIAAFARFYGMDTYRGTSMRWPTRDGVIPSHVFFTLERGVARIDAREQLNAYHTTLLGVAQVMGGPEGKRARDDAVRVLSDLAYPTSADD